MRYPVLDAIDRIALLGYEGMELMADVPHAWPGDWSEAHLSGIRTRLRERGLVLSNINAFMMNAVQDFWHPSWIERDAGFRQLRVQHTKDALRLARFLGATNITTEPGGPLENGMSYEAAMTLFVEGLQEVLPVAEAEGVLLLVEPEPGLLIENADQFLELADRVHSPAFGLNFDIGHFFCVGEVLSNTIRRLSRWARHYHVEDIAATRVHQHLIPGHGAINFGEVFSAIQATGYAGWATVELYPYLDDPDSAGREAREFLTPFVAP